MGLRGLEVVGKGSAEKIKLLQLVYRGRGADQDVDVALVGKVFSFVVALFAQSMAGRDV